MLRRFGAGWIVKRSTPKALGYFAHLHHGISSSEGGLAMRKKRFLRPEDD